MAFQTTQLISVMWTEIPRIHFPIVTQPNDANKNFLFYVVNGTSRLSAFLYVTLMFVQSKTFHIFQKNSHSTQIELYPAWT